MGGADGSSLQPRECLEGSVGTLAEDVISAVPRLLSPERQPESEEPALSIPTSRVFPTSLGHALHLSGFMVLIYIGDTILDTSLPPRDSG